MSVMNKFEIVNELRGIIALVDNAMFQLREGNICCQSNSVSEILMLIEHKARELLSEEISEILISTEEEGIIIKADSVGALEALNGMLKNAKVPIRRTGIGDVTKTDVVEAQHMKDTNPLLGVIFAFNAAIPKEIETLANDLGVKIFSSDIIYTIFENYQNWKQDQLHKEKEKALEKLIWPGKVKLLKGYVFRQSNPAVVGVEVSGRIKTKMRLIKDNGKEIGEIKEIQAEGKSVSNASSGEQVAVSIPGVTVGRQIKEGDEFYGFIPRSHLEIIMSKFLDELTEEELKILEIVKKFA